MISGHYVEDGSVCKWKMTFFCVRLRAQVPTRIPHISCIAQVTFKFVYYTLLVDNGGLGFLHLKRECLLRPSEIIKKWHMMKKSKLCIFRPEILHTSIKNVVGFFS